MMSLLSIAMLGAAASIPMTAPGPNGPLAGTYLDAGPKAAVVLIVPGSGPTDRDGNNPLGVAAAPYRLLAEGLANKGVSTVRIDKRGLFGSKAAVPDPNKVTLSEYAEDVHHWVASIRARNGDACVWVLGHSEGGLVALVAAQQPKDICGIILVSTPGRKLGDVLREQLKANPANAPVLDSTLAAIASLEAGKAVDVTNMHPALQRLFAPQVQDFLIDMMSRDPAKLAASIHRPVLIVQGERDMQVTLADAHALAAGQPRAKLLVVPGMNHVLKDVQSDDRAANLATYSDPSLPIDPAIVEAIADFVKR